MLRLVISGIAGRMGKRIGVLASGDKEVKIEGAIELPENPVIGSDIGEIIGIGRIGKGIGSDFAKTAGACDVLIEFTSPSATMQHLEIARRDKAGMVIGTTGLSAEEIQTIKGASSEIPIVLSPNMSIGANLLFKITDIAARTLSRDYKVAIVEAHHAKKKDAPSGTAKRLGEAVSKARGEMPPIESIREGDIVGDHIVTFTGKEERVELKHSAFSRDAFARGALKAAKFLKDKRSGFYTMHDVIK